jgi:hypothetical protein
MTKRAVLFLLLSLSIASIACKGKGAAAPEELAALSLSEANAFATTLGAALNTCDKAQMHRLIDVHSMMRRAARQSKAKGREQQELLVGMRQNGGDIRAQFCGSGQGSEGMHFLRIHERAGRQALLFRSVTEESLNYIEFYPGKSKDGSTKVDDIYIYMNGQTLVETLTQMIDVLLGDESMVAAFEKISADLESDPAAAFRAIEALPKKARDSKPLQMLKIQAASSIDDEAYGATIAGYEALFPGDPSLNLVSIDGYIARKNYPKALDVIDKLDASLGGDDYLDELRIGLLLEEGKDLGRAVELAEKAVTANPESQDAHYLLLGVHVANRNFAGATAIMRLMGERFELVFETDGLDPSDPDYNALKASPEWEAYQATLSATP